MYSRKFDLQTIRVEPVVCLFQYEKLTTIRWIRLKTKSRKKRIVGRFRYYCYFKAFYLFIFMNFIKYLIL